MVDVSLEPARLVLETKNKSFRGPKVTEVAISQSKLHPYQSTSQSETEIAKLLSDHQS